MSSVPKTMAAHGEPPIRARFKVAPEDFKVAEQLSIDFSGEGEHLYLHIEKTGRNTADVVKGLKRCFGVPKKDIGTAGMKDKHAVTSQWFSVLTPSDAEPLIRWLKSDDAPPYRLLESVRHSRKLRTGAHTGNAFIIRLHDVVPYQCVENPSLENPSAEKPSAENQTAKNMQTAVAERIQQLVKHGFPNYYGPQRFGHNGSNITSAIRWLTQQGRIPSMARDKRSLYLSAIRSAAFNRVLLARVQAGTWNTLRCGELCVLNGTRSVFSAADDELSGEFIATKARLNVLDIHPSAPLIGQTKARDAVSVSEAHAFDQEALANDLHYEALLSALTRLRVEASQRATRALCEDLTHSWVNENTLELSVSLSPGVFATTLMAEVFREIDCRPIESKEIES